MDIPVYLVAGFLDAGKTNFINGILEDGFAREDKTLLLCCEEGEEEYEKKALDNVTVVTVDDEDELTADFCRELEKKYRPKQVLIEYNGMWQMEKLYRDVLPANWVLYQIMTFVQAPTFELFVKNMGQLMMEKITNADMLVFNRCTPELKEALRARNLRMVNRRADIYLEDNDGNSEDYLTGNECPFDMTPDLIDIPDDDYGVWYVDVMDHLDRWDGKRVHMKLLMCHSKKFPGVHCPGRFVMTCCENDIQFVGVVARARTSRRTRTATGWTSPPPSARSISRRIRAKAPCCMWTRSPPAPSPRRRSFRSESKKEAMRCMASSANEKLPPSARRGLFPFYSSSGKGTMSLRHGRQQYASGHSRRVRAGFHASPTAPTFSMLSRVNHAGSFAPSGRKYSPPRL